MHGTGKLTNVDGNFFEGEFNLDKPYSGVIKNSDGLVLAQLMNGQRHDLAVVGSNNSKQVEATSWLNGLGEVLLGVATVGIAAQNNTYTQMNNAAAQRNDAQRLNDLNRQPINTDCRKDLAGGVRCTTK